ncbi:MAG: hypothetical protein D4R45_00725 [Planctomycetaceae bacterium]|nr:MAG: hypothetical protein D4R45_00725 [Planctomycetaceae bacterium]
MGKTIKKAGIPGLQTGEQTILQNQGAYKSSPRSGWKIAWCFLTNRRFIICQGSTIRFNISLDDITDLMVDNVHYVISKKKSLRLFYNSKKDSAKNRIWFVTPDLDDWKKKIRQASLLNVDVATVEKIAAQLDHDGQDILWYLWDKRHARIDQLAELIDAPNHMHVLMNIRETINPFAEKIIGCPILSFERSRVDPETGEAVSFSWWLIGKYDKWVPSDDRLLDIFDEDSYIQVVMEVKGIEEPDLKLDVEKDQIAVMSVKTGSTWKEIIDLPAEIDPDSPEMHLKNNLLEIRLFKRNQ